MSALHLSGEVGAVVGFFVHAGPAEHKLDPKPVFIEYAGQGIAVDGFDEAESQDQGMVVFPAGAGCNGRIEVDAPQGEEGMRGGFTVAVHDPFIHPTR